MSLPALKRQLPPLKKPLPALVKPEGLFTKGIAEETPQEKVRKQRIRYIASQEPQRAVHPLIHAIGMTPVETLKDLSKVSWFKYVYPEEREAFVEMEPGKEWIAPSKTKEQAQVRQLLYDTLEAVSFGAIPAYGKAAGQIVQKQFPRLYKLFTTPIGKKQPMTVAQKIQAYKTEHGEHPSAETINQWWDEAAGKAGLKPVKEPKPPPVEPKAVAVKPTEVLPEELVAEERIAGMALKMEDGRVITGADVGVEGRSHYEIWDKLSLEMRDRVADADGVVTNKGRFLTREEAAEFVGKADELLDASELMNRRVLPKYAQSVNLEKQNIPVAAKELELQMAGPRKVQTWDETAELSDAILSDLKKTDAALKKVKGLEGLTENMEAVRQANVNQISNLARMADDLKAGTISTEEFNASFAAIRDNFFKVTSEGSSEIGRALNIHKRMLAETDHMVSTLAKIEKDLTPKQIDDLVAAFQSKNPDQVAKFTAELEDPRLKDYVLEFWYNSILSGPPTHAVNTISNTLWSVYQMGHRVHKTLWDSIFSTIKPGRPRERFFSEIVPSLAGYGRGWKRGTKVGLETFRTGKLQEFETKWAQEIGLSTIAAWERSPSALMRKVAPLVSTPTRALRAMDVWANAIGYDSEMAAIATREGIRKGLKGDALKAFSREFVKNPTDEAHESAMAFAKHSTFMDDPDKFTNWVLQLRRVPVVGPASQFVVPFVRTIGNLLKRGLELTPGIGVGKEAISRAMGRGMPTPQVVAKQIEGAILGLYILHKSDMGEITGAVPESKAERERFYEQGKKPWAIRFGNTWYSYRRAEPLNTVIASVSIAHKDLTTAKDDDTRLQIFTKMVKDLKNNFLDASYFEGLQTVFDRHEKLEKGPRRFAATFVPYSSFWRSMNRAYEKATEGEAKVREQDTWLAAFAQVIPGLSGKVPARLNIWGEETVIPGTILQHWLPYKWSKETDDYVEIELERLNNALKDSPTGLRVFPGQPTQTVTIRGEKVKLDKDVYRDYLIDLGRELRRTYERAMFSEGYANRTDEQKAKILKRRERRAREKIRSKLIRKLRKE